MSDEDLRRIFQDPRTHLGYRYHKKPREEEKRKHRGEEKREKKVDEICGEEKELTSHLAYLDTEIENAMGGEVILLQDERIEVVEALQRFEDEEESARSLRRHKEERIAKEVVKRKLREARGLSVAWTSNLQPFVYESFASTVVSVALCGCNSIALVYDNGTVAWEGDEIPTDLRNLLYLSKSTKERKRRYHPTYLAAGSEGRFYARFDDGSERYNTNSPMLDEIISTNDVSKCAFGRADEMAVVLTDGRLLWNFEATEELQRTVDLTYEQGGAFIDVTLSDRGDWFLRGQVGGRETHCFNKRSCAGRVARLMAKNRKQIKAIYFGGDEKTFLIRFVDL